MENDLVLVNLDSAYALLAEADIYQTKNILDMASAAEVYARRQKLSQESIGRATSIKVEALRQLGNMIKNSPKNAGARGIGISGVPSEYPTYEELGLDKKIGKLAQDIASLPEEQIDLVRQGVMSLHEAERKVKTIKREAARTEMAEAGASIPEADRWHVWQADIATWQAPRQYDFIITDPPYPKEYLSLYSVLAQRAKEWLKPTGLLIAMCGQSYLDEIYKLMGEHLTYYWTSCYLTPHQPTPLRQKQVNTSWKPLLVYSPSGEYSGKTFGDVYTSPQPGKDNHEWEQSEEGMLAIIKQVCLPGQYILDPFLGAGTTGIAALRFGCLFDGIDIDENSINISKARLNDTTA